MTPLHEALGAAISAARAAGRMLREAMQHREVATTTKSNRHDVVTEFDRLAESMIVERLRAHTPEHGILSEEGARHKGTSGATWVIDPLDGTNNFVNRLPHFATSIGLVHGNERLIACVYDPMRDEMFTAIRGHGAQCNGSPLRVSQHAGLDGAFLGVGVSIHEERRRVTLERLGSLIAHVRGWRTTGSAALDLAYVAAGRLDACWYLSLSAWDVAAGALLVEASGGRVTALDGMPLDDPQDGVIASNGSIHSSMVSCVSGRM